MCVRNFESPLGRILSCTIIVKQKVHRVSKSFDHTDMLLSKCGATGGKCNWKSCFVQTNNIHVSFYNNDVTKCRNVLLERMHSIQNIRFFVQNGFCRIEILWLVIWAKYSCTKTNYVFLSISNRNCQSMTKKGIGFITICFC